MPSSADQLRWLELELTGPVEEAPYLENDLVAQGFEGWVVDAEQPEFCWVLYLPQQGSWPGRLRLLETLSAQNKTRLRTRGRVKDEDWAQSWKAFYHPLRVGERIVICPSWEVFESKPDDCVVTLDPGSAFGTGYHETTRLCLEFLQEYPPCDRVLDYGCGSGILSIACLRLGARSVLALDRDPVAVRVALENFGINGVMKAASCREASSPPTEKFDLVLANLTVGALLELRELLVAAVSQRLIASGIILERAEEVLEAYSACGLSLAGRKNDGEWVALCFETT